MSLLDDVPVGTIVGLDTAPVIYFVEAHAQYGPLIHPFFDERVDKGLDEGVTSTVTLGEALVRPLADGRADLVQQFRDFLTATQHMALVAITQAVAERAAELRARYNLRLPDAFQISAALGQGATHFITNDKGQGHRLEGAHP
jgi:predicted nucleic acid-binding protein